MKRALKFIILLGVVSLFADITYEGARSILGPYLSLLGASGAIVGTVVGFGEFVGYAIRFLSGYLADKTKRFWLITFVGYTINLFAVPLLAFAGNWQIAALLIILERFGKAIRVPARDAMLSYATKSTGRGWGFGIHEALDQVGALLGPLLISLVLLWRESYPLCFALLLLPALIAIFCLAYARRTYPTPQNFEVPRPRLATKGFSRFFWIYVAAVSLVGAGYVDFALIAYHFHKISSVPPIWIPLFYTLAMGIDGLSALLCGRLFDKIGIPLLMVTTAISALFAPLVFMGNFTVALIGMLLWGIGFGAQESIMRAAVATLVPPEKRATAYGTMHFSFGLFWFLGSALMGFLYDISIPYLILFSLAAQLASLPLFFILKTKKNIT